ncbi:MAG: mechanosensitive ion channel [Desulfobacteraceae bacterium]|nr:mechanosensitive ion channel [Desulfobacteraceae bacterium]
MKVLLLARNITFVAVMLIFTATALPAWAAAQPGSKSGDKEEFTISDDMGQAMSRQAGQVKKQIQKQASPLFQRKKLGFDWGTVEYLYETALSLPPRIPELSQKIVEQSHLLGVVGSLLVLLLFAAVIYSLVGQKRIMTRIGARVAPLQNRIPEKVYPYLLPTIHIIVAALLPWVLLAAYALVDALISYDAGWFTLIGRLLKLWAIGALIISLLREMLTGGLLKTAHEHGKSIFRLARLVAIYTLFGFGLFWTALAFNLRQDVLALLRFCISLSIALALFLLALKKNALLSLLPQLPHRSYQKFLNLFRRCYFPLILFSLILAVLGSLGYRALGRALLAKIWMSGAIYLAIMMAYHLMLNALLRWHTRTDRENEAAQLVFRSCKNLLIYGTTLATVLIVLNLLGLLGLLEQAMSFPVFELGKAAVTLWILIKAAVILVAFVFFSRFSQSYLDYKVYPAVGIEPGLGYALNTFLKYLVLAMGILISLNIVGLDLRFLLVFGGALGIGVGMGLQNLASNIISGFTLIFGGKLRKGDWIQVGGTMGMVTDIHLRATMVRTRDEIEYIIPNNEFISGTLINYSLGSPLICVEVPVGVSYNANPRQVEQILLEVARTEPSVSKERPAAVRFIEFGDSSINFQVLVWINVRTTPLRLVRSNLYFSIFENLAKAGIEIPFPQRDIHIRSSVATEAK